MCWIPEAPEFERSYEADQESTFVSAISDSDEPDLIPDRATIRKEQDANQILKIVKEWVKKGEKPKIQANRTPPELISYWKQFSLLKIEDGLLMRKWVSKKDIEQGRDLIVIPESLIETMMKLYHSNIMSCHPGVQISVEKCRRKFYWTKMADEFGEFISACEICSATKQPRSYLRAPLKHILFHQFNDAVIIDHIVPEQTQKTPRGFRYILTITDAWSNYLVAIPVRTQTAKENIQHIVRRWTLIFGIPREIIVDNHKSFHAEFFNEVLKYFDCKVTHGTAYKSRSTGRAEKSNKRVNQALRACLPAGKERDWDIYLGYAVYALNSLKNRSSGYSSNRLVFGKEINTPITLLVDSNEDDEFETRSVSKSTKGAYELYKRMKQTVRKVRENADRDFMYSKNYHDKNLLGPYFKAGDLCYVLINCPTHKFSIRWRGPLMINKVINEHLYVIQIAPGREKTVNISKLKHYKRNKYNKDRFPFPPTPSQPLQKKQATLQTPVPSPHRDDSDDDDEDEFVTVQNTVGQRTSTSGHVIPTSQRPAVPTQALPTRLPHCNLAPTTSSPVIVRAEDADVPTVPTNSGQDSMETDPTVSTDAGGDGVHADTDEELDRMIEQEDLQLEVEQYVPPPVQARYNFRDRSAIRQPNRLGSVNRLEDRRNNTVERDAMIGSILNYLLR